MDPEELPASVAADADEFGRHNRGRGWERALLIVRNVTPNDGEGRPSKTDSRESVLSAETRKVSGRAFAERAGVGQATISRYYRAWQSAADAGHVPQPETLAPGDRCELPDPDLWTEFYNSRSDGRGLSEDRTHAIRQQAKSTGTAYGKAVDVARNPGSMTTAILADSKTAEAAREALHQVAAAEQARHVITERVAPREEPAGPIASTQTEGLDGHDHARNEAADAPAELGGGIVSTGATTSSTASPAPAPSTPGKATEAGHYDIFSAVREVQQMTDRIAWHASKDGIELSEEGSRMLGQMLDGITGNCALIKTTATAAEDFRVPDTWS